MQISDSNREKQIQSIVDDCLVRRANGENLADEEIIARHSSLMPELADQLRFLRLVQIAAHQSSITSSGLRLRCPVCQAPNLLSLDSDLSQFECSACGNPFRLADEEGDAGIYPARTLGHFRLLERIGGGAFGSVWKAEDTKLDRIVAIKLPLGTRLCDQSVSRFVREAQLAAQMRHPNIVAVHEVGFEDDLVFIVSDLIAGVDLRQWLSANRPSQVEAIRIGMTLADALAYAHSQGVIHRDVKPSNILIDGRGTVFITDFGLAKGKTGELTLTMEGKVLGTPDYMPPEQVRGLASASDPRADVYSLGVVLFEMLTGERPFRGDTRMVLHQALTCDPPSLRRLNPDIHRDLDTICLKCLEKDPRQRYPTATALREELERYSRGLPVHARPLGSVARAWRWGCRNKRVALLGMGLVTSLLSIAIISTAASLNIRYYQREAIREASELALDRGLSLCEKGEVTIGLLWIARSLELFGDRDVNLSRVGRSNLAGWSPLLSPITSSLSQKMPVTCVAFSSNGQRFVCGSEDGSVRLGSFQSRVINSEGRVGASRPSVLSVLHGGPVTVVAFSPDDLLVATGSEDGIVQIYNADTGRPTVPPIQHTEGITSLEFSRDGKQFLSGCKDTFARTWDVSTGKRIGEPLHHGTTIKAAKFVNSDTQIVIVGGTRAALWNASKGERCSPICEHPTAISAASVSANGQQLLTGCSTNSGGGESRTWNLANGKLIDEPQQFTSLVSCVALSPDGHWALAGCQSGEVRWWNRHTGKQIRSDLLHDYEVRCAAFSPDSQRIATGSFDGTARLWNVADGQSLGSDLRHDNHVGCLAFSPEGTSILTGSHDGKSRLWDVSRNVTQGRLLQEQETGKDQAEFSMRVQFSRDGKLLLTGNQSGSASVWESSTGQPLGKPLKHPASITALAFSLDRQRLAIGCADGTLCFWETDSGMQIHSDKHAGEITEIVPSPDGRWWLSGSRDGQARLWDMTTGKESGTPWNHPGTVWFVGFRRDGQVALTSCADGVVRLWDVTDRKQRNTQIQHPYPAWEAYFTRDGEHIVTGCGPFAGSFGQAQVWDAETGSPRGPAMHHFGAVSSMAISPDEKLLATASFDHSVKLWDMKTSLQVREPLMHHDRVWSVVFSPDGQTLLTSSDDQTAQVWDVASGKPLGPLMKHNAKVRNADFCADNHTIATGAFDNSARTWRVPESWSGDLHNLIERISQLTGTRLQSTAPLRYSRDRSPTLFE